MNKRADGAEYHSTKGALWQEDQPYGVRPSFWKKGVQTGLLVKEMFVCLVVRTNSFETGAWPHFQEGTRVFWPLVAISREREN